MSLQADAAILSRAWSRPDPAEFPERAEEFERLFVGPGSVPCPPYESFWRRDVPSLVQGVLMGPCTTELVSLYTAMGLLLSRSSAELPDHVAVELEALSVTATRPDGAAIAVALVAEHLSLWLPAFCEAVLRASRHPYYRSLARTTSEWIAGAAARSAQSPS